MLDITTEPAPDEMTDPQEPGLPRLVCEAHARLGGNATPEQVAADLKARGIDTCVDDVKACWPEGGKSPG
jgi:hypothetical protein